MDWPPNPVADADFDETRHTSPSKLVRDPLSGRILSGAFTPGQALPEPELADRLEAVLSDDSKVHVFVEHAIGPLQQSMSDTGPEAKFHGMADTVLGSEQTVKLLEACWSLGKSADIKALMQSASTAA